MACSSYFYKQEKGQNEVPLLCRVVISNKQTEEEALGVLLRAESVSKADYTELDAAHEFCVEGKRGHVDAALQVVAEALQLVERTDERFCEAELYRLKGELIFQSPGESPTRRAQEAKACSECLEKSWGTNIR